LNEQEFSAAEAMIQKESIAEIFDRLQPYTITIANPATPDKLNGHATSQMVARDPNLWHHLTSSIKGALLTKITGQQWNHWQVSSTNDYKPTVRHSSVPDNSIHKDQDEVLRFVFPKSTRTFSDDSSGRDRTEQAIIHGECTYEDSDEIIGELQFCYITGMHLGNLACMEHWAHIVKVCTSTQCFFV
jgi:A1 cistron-splicing factor AAR2